MSNIDERNTDYNTSGRLEDDKIDIIAILLDMWKGVRKFWLLLLIIAIVCAGIFFAYNKLTYTPLYRLMQRFLSEEMRIRIVDMRLSMQRN